MEFKNVNPAQLQDEFIEAGIKLKEYLGSDLKKGEFVAENAWCKFEDDTDMALVNTIYQNHMPTKPTEITEDERIRKIIESMGLGG